MHDKYWVRLAIVVLVLLGAFSLYLAVNRIFQVDEAQNVFTARILGTHAWARYETHAPLYLMGPMAWLARRALSASELFTQARLLFLCVFWLNIALLALNLGAKLNSRRGLAALLAAATLTPLWDYGFEIRHDNLLLTALLLGWLLVRARNIRSFAAMGGIGLLAVLAQFTAFKAFLFFLPLSAALLLFPPAGWKGGRWKQGAGLAAGVLLGLALARLAFGTAGAWQVHFGAFLHGVAVSAEVQRFPPWDTLLRLLRQAPLVMALALGALASWAVTLRVEGRNAFTWSGPLPEIVLALGVTGILLVNPTPFAYNLLLVAPFMLLALRDPWLKADAATLMDRKVFPWLAALVLAVHALPFTLDTARHLSWTNDRQVALMDLAEELTDPKADAVYDGAGLVPTRDSIGFHWYLHSLNIKNYASGKWPTVRAMMTACPAAVLLTSYRTDWLPKEDKDFIRSNYIPLADDFWVLGTGLPAGGGQWVCLHPGRYVFRAQAEGKLQAGTVKVDGLQVGEAPVLMAAGPHHLEGQASDRIWVAWTGPKVNDLPRLGAGDHQQLFVNWY